MESNNLPISNFRKELIKLINENNVVIVVGETGSGKSTQLPQYILKSKHHQSGLITCIQPRRIAAVNLSKRVSHETKTKLGELVGYTIRFDNLTSQKTKLKFMTDGILVRESMSDNLLLNYSHIILDEAHERSVYTDILMGLLKQIQLKRQNQENILKIIIMSATLDSTAFSTFFNNAPIFKIPGRKHCIRIMHTKNEISDYLYSCLVSVFQINASARDNRAILLFLTGYEEIEASCSFIRQMTRNLPDNVCKLLPMPLYSNLPPKQQQMIFKKAPNNMRKVIISTNIAETSLTIPDVKYVIDCGFFKTKYLLSRNTRRTERSDLKFPFTTDTSIETIQILRLSKAQAIQRSGRAGRVSDGICYRMYTELQYENLDSTPVPPITTCALENVFFQMIALGISRPDKFPFVNCPLHFNMHNALMNLLYMKIIEKVTISSGFEFKISKNGAFMAKFPIDPRYSRIIFLSKDNHLICSIIAVIALLSADGKMFVYKKRNCVNYQKFGCDDDLLTILSMFVAFKNTSDQKKWCDRHLIIERTMLNVDSIYNQLCNIFQECYQKKVNQDCLGQNNDLAKYICMGMYLNSAYRQKDKSYKTFYNSIPVLFHPSSTLFINKKTPDYVVYDTLICTKNVYYMKNICSVKFQDLLDADPKMFTKFKKN
ncbi:hypothetical protein A3Q56_04713 [Intoshia linei]|uniref:RNA helicase n=1 Tax=Intoshia linei TaxID=1819745 RepID=A0A177B006_9BILA|nr:hypothetical protein A3Q56_04713 [Intoshia linei]